jgi:hypothetical protein
MATKYIESSAVHLFRYMLASADMYYSEVEERDVFIGNDENGAFSIWGETAEGGPATKISLCEVFLEYGLYCCSWCSLGERLYHMQNFGERLGHAVSRYLQENPTLLAGGDRAVRALEDVFGAIGACFAAEYAQDEIRFTVTDCPLENTARHSGLANLELAHHGINAMCRSLIIDLDPGATVNASSEIRPGFILTIKEPIVA